MKDAFRTFVLDRRTVVTSAPLAAHLKPLAGLWSASIVVAGANFLASILIVANSSADVYAAYAVGLAILQLSTALCDGGLAGTMNVLAVRDGRQPKSALLYRKIGNRLARRVVPIGFVAVLALTLIMSVNSSLAGIGLGSLVLGAFVASGAIGARGSFHNALTYACGDFKRFSISQALPAVARLLLVLAAVVLVGSLGINLLATLTVVGALFAWLLALKYLKRAIANQAECDGYGRQGLDPETAETSVKRFLRPSALGVVLGAVASNATLLGSSFYATGEALAPYGVFLRLNQVAVMISGPLNQYAARRLRLVLAPGQRRRESTAYLRICIGGYASYGLVSFLFYCLLAAGLDHYSLRYSIEFAIFLLYNGIGHLQVALDSVLAAGGTADHRVVGNILLSVLNVSLIPIFEPSDVLAMVLIGVASVVPTTLYYLYLFVFRDRAKTPSPMPARAP